MWPEHFLEFRDWLQLIRHGFGARGPAATGFETGTASATDADTTGCCLVRHTRDVQPIRRASLRFVPMPGP